MQNTDGNPVLVLDSGLGGLSVLRHIQHYAPGAGCIYYGATAFAPYGSKTTKEIRARVLSISERLVKECRPRALVWACNTATSAAIQEVRREFPDIPVIGTEPALKPAVEQMRMQHMKGRILVMATPVTLRETKFQNLLRQYEKTAPIDLLPAPELVRIIESCLDIQRRAEEYLLTLKPSLKGGYSLVVLGCTHFPVVKEAIRNVFGRNVRFCDGGDGVARRLIQLVPDLTREQKQEPIQFLCSSSDPENHFPEKCRMILELLAGDKNE